MDYIGRVKTYRETVLEIRRGDGMGIDAFMGLPVVVNPALPPNVMHFGEKFYIIGQPGGGEHHDNSPPHPA